MGRFVKVMAGGQPRVVDLATDGVLIPGNFQSYYAGGAYSAYTGMWGHYLPQNDQLVAESSMRVHPENFPARTTFYWDVTPDPDWGGINGYLHVAWGNYDNSPGSITPRKVSTISQLRMNVGWSFTGDTSTGLLCECWLSSTSAASGAFTKLFEVAFLPKLSPGAISFVAGLPAVGPGSFTDSSGVVWNVREGDSATGEPYFMGFRPGYADFNGALPFRDLFAFLTIQGKITGNEWFNGLAFGPEPHHGAGSVTINTFSPTYS